MSFTDLSPLSSRQLRAISPAAPPEAVRSRARTPRGFTPIRGSVSNVRFGGSVPHNVGHTAAQKEGLRYEQRVHDVLTAIYGIDYRPAPAILFEDRSGLRRAIPDGILRIGPVCVIVEIKLSHTERAWWQLNRLYAPLLSALVVPGTPIRCVEICRSYDPEVQFPVAHKRITSLHSIPHGTTGVLLWKI